MTLNALSWLRRGVHQTRDEEGFAVAELLAIAALSVIVLVVIFGAMQTLGLDTVGWMRRQLLGA